MPRDALGAAGVEMLYALRVGVRFCENRWGGEKKKISILDLKGYSGAVTAPDGVGSESWCEFLNAVTSVWHQLGCHLQ